MLNIKFKIKDFSTITMGGSNRTTLYVDVLDVPPVIPLECNPREQNMGSRVVKDMEETLLTQKGLFHILNRGITVIADKCTICDDGKSVMLDITDLTTQGCVDGGHTYKCILRNQPLILERGFNFVTIEVLDGDDVKKNFTMLAKARNRSQQVQDCSIAELEGTFDYLKPCLDSLPLKVKYKENEPGDISIENIAWFMTLINRRFGEPRYNRSGTCLKSLIEYSKRYGESMDNPYWAVTKILEEAIAICDYIEYMFPKVVKRLGLICDLKKGKYKSMLGKSMVYKIPKQFYIPVFVVFIHALTEIKPNGEILFTRENPMGFVEENLPLIANMLIDVYRKTREMETCRRQETINMLFMKLENILLHEELNK